MSGAGLRGPAAAGHVVDIRVGSADWHAVAAPGELEALVERAAQAALAMAQSLTGPDGERWEVSILLSDDATVRVLNRGYRGIDKPTNVLSFALQDEPEPSPAEEQPVVLGDVVLAFETCRHEADSEHRPLADHLSHLIVHGVLHLTGFDHRDEADAERMEDMERAVLARLGIPDPYAADTIPPRHEPDHG